MTIEVPAQTINLTLPASIPLMCDVEQACQLFGLGKTTFDALRKAHSDFPVRKIGRNVMYLVPDLYAWFRDFPDGRIETE